MFEDPRETLEETININAPAGSAEFLGGSRRFLTKKLWGAANKRPYFHYGQFTTLRDATTAHAVEAQDARQNFERLADTDLAQVIEFLRTLQVPAPRH